MAPTPERSACRVLLPICTATTPTPGAIGRALAPGGRVLRPPDGPDDPFAQTAVAGVEQELVEADIATESIPAWWSGIVGPCEVTAVPASDGTGGPQVSRVAQAAAGAPCMAATPSGTGLGGRSPR